MTTAMAEGHNGAAGRSKNDDERREVGCVSRQEGEGRRPRGGGAVWGRRLRAAVLLRGGRCSGAMMVVYGGQMRPRDGGGSWW
ncbi:triose phosphate/phosphate translocator, chloroplastic [Sesbania bispinosa]|nr:triose phosphate/phosphate translocator, chloroplastic [Sesbania bispinosa]